MHHPPTSPRRTAHAREPRDVRHKGTGQKAVIPEAALRHLPDYQKTAQQLRRDDIPDGTAFPADTAPTDQPTAKAATAAKES